MSEYQWIMLSIALCVIMGGMLMIRNVLNDMLIMLISLRDVIEKEKRMTMATRKVE